MTPLRFQCPTCHTSLKASSDHVGKKTRCGKCGQKLQIPGIFQAKTVLATARPEEEAAEETVARTPPPPPPPAHQLPGYEPTPGVMPRRVVYVSLLAAVGTALILAGCGVAGFLAFRNAEVTMPAAEAPPEIDLAVLLSDWKKNPIGTQQRYGARPVRITGAVLVRVDNNLHNQQYVILGTDPENRGPELLVYVLDRTAYRQLAAFDVGSPITADVIFDQGADRNPRASLWAARKPVR